MIILRTFHWYSSHCETFQGFVWQSVWQNLNICQTPVDSVTHNKTLGNKLIFMGIALKMKIQIQKLYFGHYEIPVFELTIIYEYLIQSFFSFIKCRIITHTDLENSKTKVVLPQASDVEDLKKETYHDVNAVQVMTRLGQYFIPTSFRLMSQRLSLTEEYFQCLSTMQLIVI